MSKELSYVVGITRPDTVRRSLLESARHSITILKEKKTLVDIRKQRKEKMSELHETLNNMHESLAKLHGVLPKQKDLPAFARKKQEEQKKQAQEKTGSVSAPAKNSVSDLTEIKGLGPARIKKLSSIDITSIADLAQASRSDLADADIVAGTAKKLIQQAKDIIGEQELDELDEPVSTSEAKAKSEMDLLEEKLSAIESKLKNL